MAGEINFGILDTNLPMKAAQAFDAGRDEKRKSRLAEMAMQQQEQEMADETARRDAYKQSNGDMNAFLRALQAGGLYKQANELQKQQLEADAKRATISKDKSTAGKNEFDVKAKKAEFLTTATASLMNNPTYENFMASIRSGVESGMLTPEEAQHLISTTPNDPAQIKQMATQANQQLMSAKDRMAANQPMPKEVNLGNRVVFVDMNPNSPTFKQEVSSQNVGMSPGESARLGQAERHFKITSNQAKVPSGYRAMPDGSLQAIPGGPADPNAAGGKAPTEFQGKSATFGARAEEADRVISDLIKTGAYSTVGSTVAGGNGIGSAVLNPVLSKNTQRAIQAQRDFINAVLRQESGAAISQPEFDNAAKQYFPQPGDSKEVIAQKERNRKLAVQGFFNSAGKAAFHAKPVASDGWTVTKE
jgi:hypothetical protein